MKGKAMALRLTVYDLICELSKIYNNGKPVSMEGESSMLWPKNVEELEDEVVIRRCSDEGN